MKCFKNSVELLEKEFKDNNVKITYHEKNELDSDATIFITCEHYSESIDAMYVDDEYYLDASVTSFRPVECKSVEDVIDIIRKRVNFALKMNGPKIKPVDIKKLTALSKKHNINITEFIGSTFIESSGFKVLADLEKELAYLTVGLKTVEIPFDRVNATLESLSSFEIIN